jgi:hypothetical protein
MCHGENAIRDFAAIDRFRVVENEMTNPERLRKVGQIRGT